MRVEVTACARAMRRERPDLDHTLLRLGIVPSALLPLHCLRQLRRPAQFPVLATRPMSTHYPAADLARITPPTKSMRPTRPRTGRLPVVPNRCPGATSSALVAQGIEHRSPKAGVAGSNPAEGTNLRRVSAGQQVFLICASLPDSQQNRKVQVKRLPWCEPPRKHKTWATGPATRRNSGPADFGATRLPFQQRGKRLRLRGSDALSFRTTDASNLEGRRQPVTHHVDTRWTGIPTGLPSDPADAWSSPPPRSPIETRLTGTSDSDITESTGSTSLLAATRKVLDQITLQLGHARRREPIRPTMTPAVSAGLFDRGSRPARCPIAAAVSVK